MSTFPSPSHYLPVMASRSTSAVHAVASLISLQLIRLQRISLQLIRLQRISLQLISLQRISLQLIRLQRITHLQLIRLHVPLSTHSIGVSHQQLNPLLPV